MSSFLSLDASTESCSVTLCCGSTFYQQSCHTPRAHAKTLLPMIEAVLADAGIKLGTLDFIALTHGPGSFTGIRIALSVAQGLAYGASLPLVGISSLRTLAERCYLEENVPNGGVIIPALDARMSEVYWAAYQYVDGSMRELCTPAVSSPPDAIQAMEARLAALNVSNHDASVSDTSADSVSRPIYGAGHGWGVDGMSAQILDHCFTSYSPDATAVAKVVLGELAEITPTLADRGIAVLEPLYLRNEIAWKKRTRIRPQSERQS
ncbi:MAG: tRNA (adenosine(37)-N6)-threonylcarbamoyltransferase complex dimerization subunit type 1 TsaB [Alteromonadaceae bacterium]|nr:MAG: tRNA (adenosine(37)-N6)-threonylcarbamoyltransferase complex dimerization subunit type 1 TsaB [Alteromonadaceae bacterium]